MFSLCITETDPQYSIEKSIRSNFTLDFPKEKIDSLKFDYQREESAILTALQKYNPQNIQIVSKTIQIHLRALRKISKEVNELVADPKLHICGMYFSCRKVSVLTDYLGILFHSSAMWAYFVENLKNSNSNFIAINSIFLKKLLEKKLNNIKKELIEHRFLFDMADRTELIIKMSEAFIAISQLPPMETSDGKL